MKKRDWIDRVRTQFVSIIVGQQANFYPPMQCIQRRIEEREFLCNVVSEVETDDE